MDLPPFHHRRYQPFSDTSTDSFYCPQPHSLRPPPPLPSPLLPPLPPPPSSTILPLAPQPPPPPSIPPPSQSQFSFRHNPTIEERSLQLPNFIPSHILHQHRPPLRPPSPTRVSSHHHSSRSQQLRFEDNSRFSDPWTDMPLLPRLRAEPSLRHLPISPLSPITGSYSNDFQSGLRFRDEYRDEGFRGDVSPQLPLWGRKETRFDTRDDVDDREYRYGSGRERYKWNSNRGNRDFVSADSRGTTDFSWNQSRDFDLDIGDYNLYNRSEADVRCGISNMEAERGKYGNNSVHLRAERSELFENSGFQDLSRSNSNRVGEKRTDLFFSRSPRKKQLQKKSALQRIQLGKANNNNRNRNYDYSHFPKSYHDESNSVVGGSFKGKETDVHACLERKIEEREKSPVELDVLFKSNALIAKAIKATPSPIVDSNRNLMSRNRKIRKMNLSDSPGTGLSENLDGTESSTDPLVKDNQESANNAFADKNDRSILVSHHSNFPNKSEKSTEKVTAIRTESCIFCSDIPSDTDKDHGQLTKKTRVSLNGSLSSGGLEPFPSGLDGNTANNESPMSVESSQGVEVAASDGIIDGTPRKRKRIACPLQPKSDGHEQTSQDFPSADLPLQAIPLDEGLSSSAGTSIVSTVASDFHTDLVDEKVKSSSQEDPNMKKHDTDINSSLLLLPQSSEMASASQNSQDAFVFCEAADHGETSVLHGISGLNFDKGVEHSFQEESVLFQNCPDSKVKNSVEVNAVKENKVHDSQTEAYTSGNEGCSTSGSEQRLCRMSIHNGYSGLNFDKGLEHSFQEELVLFQNGPGSNVRDSLEVNAAKENDIHDSQMEAYTSRNEGCFTLSFEQRLCRISEKIDVTDSKNANPQEFSPNQVSLLGANDIVEDSTDPGSCVGNIDNLCVFPSKFEAVPKENFASFNSTVDLQLGSMGIASQGGTDDFVNLNGKAFSGDDSPQVTLPCRVNSASLPNNLSLNDDVSCIFSTNSADRLVGSDSEALFNNVASSSEYVPSNQLLDMQNSRSSHSELSNGRSVKQKILTKSPVSVVDTVNASSLSSKNDAKLGQGLTSSVNSQEKSLLSQNNPKVIQSSNTLPGKSSLSNNRLTTSILGGFPGHTSVKYPSVGEALPFKLVSRPRTWHRTGTSPQPVAGQKDHVTSQINLQEEPGKVQNAYVRKGNSLVRKTYPVGAVPQRLQASASKIFQLRPGIDNLKKVGGSENDINISETSTSAIIGGFVIGPERPKTPPLIGTTKPLNCMPADLGDSTGSQADSFRKNCPGETLDPSNSVEIMDVRKCSKDAHASGIKEHEDVSRSNLSGQRTIDERNSGKKITYVKQKSNQLVAFSNSSDPSFQRSEKPYPLSSDGYYKRRKNQLIRTSIEDKAEQLSDIPGKFLSPQRQEVSKKTLNRSSSKRQTGFTKKKFSLVWTLHDTLASKKEGKSGQFRTVRPFLFPWRRATYWTNFKPSLSSTSNDNLASSISRKLLLSRKCDTIYKRSLSGFSLRRSKVLGFRGRNLKWSKSIERNSKKANEDAELAVVAAEKRKSEQNGAAFTFFKSRNYVSRGRIFRIGSERYRMDPTGKTLQRISDEKSSYSENQSENKAKKFFVPRRLLIGNDEYVRIGNGNQLVRDPKKRTRVLANEKIRWSLHTARLRLARKKKYCQFFTRFGKCNKDDKKCPYIHDPSKIVVCTKFLNGCCSDSNCKLTHKVIPERMQDCSYFLQGLCSNESCPYRHVNVNPNAPVCEGFLRGYCADGNECRKKHTYVCPVFEATGNCHEGDKCKLHHPKTKKKGIKRKASMVQKNARGRYFGAQTINIANHVTAVPNVITGECDDQIFCQDGKFTDFISLADSGDAMEEAVEPRVELSCDSDRDEPSEMQVDLDELIKPVSLMKKTHVLDSSPAIDSTDEMTGSYASESSLQMRLQN